MMDITFNMTPEQQAADDRRRAEWDAEQRQHTRTLPAAEYAAMKREATKPTRPALPVAGPHASAMTDADYSAELRRLGIRKPRPTF
jgi:hypothetical protein